MLSSNIDPVCGMTVAETVTLRFTHAGLEYGFCCQGCLTKFSAQPESFLAKKPTMEAMGGPLVSIGKRRLAVVNEGTDPVRAANIETPASALVAIGKRNPLPVLEATASAAEPTAPAQGLVSIGKRKSLTVLNTSFAETRIDPVCGMTVEAATTHKWTHAGAEYWFCCASCVTKFQADPAKYLDRKQNAEPALATATATASSTYGCPMDPEVSSAGPGPCPKCGMALEPTQLGGSKTQWICPMDPEVISDVPGACPKCGMALESRTVSIEEDDSELDDMRRRFFMSVAFSVPLLILAMGDMAFHFSGQMGFQPFAVLQLVLTLPVMLAGRPLFERAVASFKFRSPNMFTLIGIGTGAAFGYSLFATLVPEWFPDGFRAHGQVALYFESAAVIVTLVLLGQVLELSARKRTGDAIRDLLSLAPELAHRVDARGAEVDVPVAELRVGDRVRVRPGERIPTDARVVEGESDVDESMVTGEPMPVHRRPGHELIGGSQNGTGAFTAAVEKVGSETLLARIIARVAEAQRTRAPVQGLADRVSAWFVPSVVVAAVVAFLVWMFFGPEPRLAYALLSAVSVLIIACPCALGLATPMSIVVAMGRGARMGVLFRDAAALERLAEVNVLAFDKTGTLTEGRPKVLKWVTRTGISESDLMRAAYLVEQMSEHPVARAIVEDTLTKNVQGGSTHEFRALPGKGARAVLDGQELLIGNSALFGERGISVEPLREESAKSSAGSLSYVARGGELLGMVVVGDSIRPEAAEVIQSLQREGVEVVMISGDSEAAARAVADKLGIRRVEAGVRPEMKADLVRKLKDGKKCVAMAGDGINDAAALAEADVGIAMGSGTDIAISSAHITLVRSHLRAILDARALSRATMTNIRQNLTFAFGYNLLGVPIAGGVLYPVLGMFLSPMLAALAMSTSSVSVIANALRLRRQKLT